MKRVEFMEYIFNNIKIRYTDEGSGKAIVLLHGWGQNIEMMQPINVNLESFRKVIIDFPGFGESDEPDVVWNVDNYVEFLHSFLNYLEIEKPILIGHSFGCRVAIKYACKYDVEKMVFTGAAGIKPKRGFSYYLRVYSYKTAKLFLKLPFLKKYESSVKSYFGSSDYKSTSGVMRGTFINVVNEDLTTYLNKIKCPVLLLWGESDDSTPIKDAYKMEKLIVDCALVKLKGTHYAYLENIDYFNIVVKEFVK